MLPGDRVRLRAIEREDIPRFLRWLNDPEVIHFLTIYIPMSRDEEERWFEQQLQDRSKKILAIETETGEHIGNVGLEDVDWKNRLATLGIVIGEKKFWGKGYGTAAIRALLRFAFEEMNLNRVHLTVFDYNERARRCYRRCGFIEEGVARQAHFSRGQYHDLVWMSILREEWERQPKSPLP